MRSGKPIESLPRNFHFEVQELLERGINTWESLREINDEELFLLARNGLATARNLQRLRGMATLICEINLSQSEAALLMHAGVVTINALSALTPQELLQKTGRLERQLNTGREPVVDLKKANFWIQSAKSRQILN